MSDDWLIDALRDDMERAIRERRKWQDEPLVFNGRTEKRGTVIRRLRALVSTFEDDGFDWRPVTAAIHEAQDAAPGTEVKYPVKRKAVV